jgi:hypothetical protein
MSVAAPLFAFALISLSPSVSPTPSLPRVQHLAPTTCIAPERTGIFRVFAAKPDGSQTVPAMLVLENIEGCLEASFVTYDRGPANIDHLSLSGDTLKGSLNVTGSPAQVTFKFSGSSVAGTIMERRQEWRVEGKRTT